MRLVCMSRAGFAGNRQQAEYASISVMVQPTDTVRRKENPPDSEGTGLKKTVLNGISLTLWVHKAWAAEFFPSHYSSTRRYSP